MGNECIADLQDGGVLEFSMSDADIDYDKKQFPIKNNLTQSVTFDCSNVRFDPMFELHVRHEMKKLQKKKELLKPKWIRNMLWLSLLA